MILLSVAQSQYFCIKFSFLMDALLSFQLSVIVRGVGFKQRAVFTIKLSAPAARRASNNTKNCEWDDGGARSFLCEPFSLLVSH
jgi:hypothetical protein